MSEYPDDIYEGRDRANKAGFPFDPDDPEVIFAEDSKAWDDEITATQTELGTNPKGSFADVKARLDALEAGGLRGFYGVYNMIEDYWYPPQTKFASFFYWGGEGWPFNCPRNGEISAFGILNLNVFSGYDWTMTFQAYLKGVWTTLCVMDQSDPVSKWFYFDPESFEFDAEDLIMVRTLLEIEGGGETPVSDFQMTSEFKLTS